MSFEIRLSKQVQKFFEKQDAKLCQRVIVIFEKLSQNPKDTTLDIKPLKGEEGQYRLRVGKFRFLYEIFENEILIYIYKADSRGDVYK